MKSHLVTKPSCISDCDIGEIELSSLLLKGSCKVGSQHFNLATQQRYTEPILQQSRALQNSLKMILRLDFVSCTSQKMKSLFFHTEIILSITFLITNLLRFESKGMPHLHLLRHQRDPSCAIFCRKVLNPAYDFRIASACTRNTLTF